MEELSHLLHRTAELCSDTVAQPTPDEDLVKTLESARGQAEVSGFLQELGESKTLLFFEAHESVSVVWQTASLSAKVARLDQEELEKEQCSQCAVSEVSCASNFCRVKRKSGLA